MVEVLSDTELVRRLPDADGAAFAEIYRRFGRLCYSLARRICADDELAEDVVHEVFQALWRDPRSFDPARATFATWLLSLTQHEAVDAVRRNGTARQGMTAEPGAAQECPPVADTGPAPPARFAAGQVRAALDLLPGEQRQVLVGAYFGGHTLREIAAFTGTPLNTVRSRLFNGVQRLRSLLADQLGPDVLVAEARLSRR